MSRQRFIHPTIWESEDFISLTVEARLLFVALFSLADDEGRGKGSDLVLAGKVFPPNAQPAVDMRSLKAEITRREMAVFYRVNGSTYYYLPTWSRYQKPEYPRPSKIPPLSEADQDQKDLFGEGSPNAHRSLTELSPVGRDGMGRVGMGRVGMETEQTPDLLPQAGGVAEKPPVKREPPGDDMDVLRAFNAEHVKACQGTPYRMVPKRDRKLVQDLLKQFGKPRVLEIVHAFWESRNRGKQNGRFNPLANAKLDIPGMVAAIANLNNVWSWDSKIQPWTRPTTTAAAAR